MEGGQMQEKKRIQIHRPAKQKRALQRNEGVGDWTVVWFQDFLLHCLVSSIHALARASYVHSQTEGWLNATQTSQYHKQWDVDLINHTWAD